MEKSSYKNPSLFFLVGMNCDLKKASKFEKLKPIFPPKKTSPSSWQHQNFSAPHLQFTKISPDTLVSFCLIDGWANLPTFPSFQKNPLSIHTSALNRSRFVDIRMLTSGKMRPEKGNQLVPGSRESILILNGRKMMFYFCSKVFCGKNRWLNTIYFTCVIYLTWCILPKEATIWVWCLFNNINENLQTRCVLSLEHACAKDQKGKRKTPAFFCCMLGWGQNSHMYST